MNAFPKGTLAITGDPEADRLLNSNALALLVGMLLDQQVPMEWAFRGPATLQERLTGFDAQAIADYEPEAFVTLCCQKPAIHRFPASMGRRIQDLCQHLVDHYHGDPSELWQNVDGQELAKRLRALPGYGEEKTKIFIALLAKRMGVPTEGWQKYAGAFADEVPRSVADIDGPEALATVRQWKKAQKAAKKSKQD
ncbi:MAG: Fe-S cluster assembly protein HesB [Acidimicrobiales bacterium]|nr:Fe-S cluster assembly protein HesB [Acidimicrobiales bacterium]